MRIFDSTARRVTLGVLLVLHGLAHTAAGFWASGRGPVTPTIALWLVATVGFVGAGFGAMGAYGLRRHWRPLLAAGVVASIVLLLGWRHELTWPGVVLDLLFALIGLLWREEAPRIGKASLRAARVGSTLAWAFTAYVAAVIGLRPWYTQWGTTERERATPLFGDMPVIDARYRIDHGITIRARPEQVWPWLVQIGQDRGGFYSYERLEQMIGADIHNTDRIHPEWQHREPGDLVRAVQPGYLGGVLGDSLGWRISALDEGRAMVLEDWGTFALRPVDDSTTRLLIRTRGTATPTPDGMLVAPVGLLVFEPAHFIMERRMLLGIRERAERLARAQRVGSLPERSQNRRPPPEDQMLIPARLVPPMLSIVAPSPAWAVLRAPQTSAVPASFAGTWSGRAEIIVIWCSQRTLDVEVTIDSAGRATGRVGDAELVDGRLRRNRGAFGRWLKVKTDYLIEGKLVGPIVARDVIVRDGVKMPVNFVDSTFVGGVHTTGSAFGDRDVAILSAARMVLRRRP